MKKTLTKALAFDERILPKILNISKICLLLLICNVFTVYAQQQKITGNITDANTGEAIIGANVVVDGTTIGVVTDINGTFSLDVPNAEAVLKVSYIGYNTEMVACAGRTVVPIKLVPDITSLEEVVVVGYGTQKKGSVTGSVTSISTEEIKNYPAANLSTMLAGRLSGVTVSQGTGKPGASSSFNIRAQGTINNYDPLFVIDGIVRDKFAFDGLDQSEVDNISVLKDGASAAIYGSRAANGVVLITTKKGKIGKPVINYSSAAVFESATRIPKMMSAYQHATYQNNGLRNSFLTGISTTNHLTSPDWFTDDELEHFRTTPDFFWFDDAWRDPWSVRHTLNVSGGSETVRYFIGGSYFKEEGSFDNLSFKKYNLRGSIEADITKNLTASLTLSMDKRNDEKPYWKSDNDNDRMNDLYKGILTRPRYIPSIVNGLPVANRIEWHPLMQIDKTYAEHLKDWNDVVADIWIEYKVPFVKGLKLKAVYNNSYRNRLIKYKAFPYMMYEFKTAGTNNHYLDPSYTLTGITKPRDNGNFVYKEDQTEQNYQLNGQVTYDKTIGKHEISALLVYEQAESSSDKFDALRNGLYSGDVAEFFAASPDPSLSTVGAGGISEGGRLSYVGRINYAYASKYLLEVSFREDGSTKFAPDKRWGFFPSVSAGWRVSSEPFFTNLTKYVDYLKIKGSFAMLGNDDVGGWQWKERFGFSNDGGGVFEYIQPGVNPKELPTDNLTWEKSRSYNGGIEGRILNRINFGVEVFYRQTYDILDSRAASVPSTFGASMPKENYSAIDSKGMEVELGFNSNPSKKLTYYIKGNIGYAKSWWVKRDEASDQRGYLSEINQPIGRVWGYQVKGMIRTDEDLANVKLYTPKILGNDVAKGQFYYTDIRGPKDDVPDGTITTDDRIVIVNNAKPSYSFGCNLGAQWKGISLDLFFQGLAGYEKMVGLGLGGINYFTNTFAFRADHWTPENPNAEYPSPSGRATGENSNFWVRDASFLRLKSATLSYNVPTKFTKKIGINSLNVYVSGTNLFLLVDNMKIMDPELTNLTDYPIMKTYSVGVNISL